MAGAFGNAAYHKLHCTTCKREMVVSEDFLKLVDDREIIKHPTDPGHPDMFYLWQGSECFMCNTVFAFCNFAQKMSASPEIDRLTCYV